MRRPSGPSATIPVGLIRTVVRCFTQVISAKPPNSSASSASSQLPKLSAGTQGMGATESVSPRAARP